MVIDTTRVPRYSEAVFGREDQKFRLETASERVLPGFIVIESQLPSAGHYIDYVPGTLLPMNAIAL